MSRSHPTPNISGRSHLRHTQSVNAIGDTPTPSKLADPHRHRAPHLRHTHTVNAKTSPMGPGSCPASARQAHYWMNIRQLKVK